MLLYYNNNVKINVIYYIYENLVFKKNMLIKPVSFLKKIC